MDLSDLYFSQNLFIVVVVFSCGIRMREYAYLCVCERDWILLLKGVSRVIRVFGVLFFFFLGYFKSRVSVLIISA